MKIPSRHLPSNPFTARQPLTELAAEIVEGSVTEESDEGENIPPVRAAATEGGVKAPAPADSEPEKMKDMSYDTLGTAQKLIEKALAQRQQDYAELAALRAGVATHEQEASQRSLRIAGLLERLAAAAASLASIQQELTQFTAEMTSV